MGHVRSTVPWTPEGAAAPPLLKPGETRRQRAPREVGGRPKPQAPGLSQGDGGPCQGHVWCLEPLGAGGPALSAEVGVGCSRGPGGADGERRREMGAG